MTTLMAGVDLGGTKIQTVVVRDEDVVGQDRQRTPQQGEAQDVIDVIITTIDASLAAAGASREDLSGIGIGTPGSIDPSTGAVQLAANVPGFSDRVELGQLLSDAFGGVRVVVQNDVRAGILGEYRRGAGRPFKNVLGVWCGTGIGGGLIMGGQLYNGRGTAGEIGHTVVQPGGRRCRCGRRGCLEAYAGRACMEKRASKLVGKGKKTDLFKIMKKKGRTHLSSGVYARALKKNDRMAVELLADAVHALGVSIASAQNLLDLEAIIIGGGMGDTLGPEFVKRIRTQMKPHLFATDHAPKLLNTELGDLSGAVGATVALADALTN